MRMNRSIARISLQLLAMLLAPIGAWAVTTPAEQRELELSIDTREEAYEGIEVDVPKIYDDSLLQQMLSTAETKLASLQVLDQAGLSSHLGAIVGARQSTSAFGMQIQGGPLAGVATTLNGPTSQTVATNQTEGVTGDTNTNTTTNGTQTTNTNPNVSSVITSPQVSPTIPTLSAPTASLPALSSVSASNILTEQMQLTYEIANLRMLLEGALSDRLVRGTTAIKPRVTVGFTVRVYPRKRYKNAVAVVEVEADTTGADPVDAKQGITESPTVIALLPQEKTYNVAAITNDSTSLGAGIVTQVIGIGANYQKSTNTYYLVKDQDTLAATFQPKDSMRTGFLWQFRPVLGAPYVTGTSKSTFVQLAFPTAQTTAQFGTLRITTYWRCYDAKHNLVGKLIPHSLHRYEIPSPVTRFGLGQPPKGFSTQAVEDLGNGQVLVTLTGQYLGGTAVRIGPNVIGEGNTAFRPYYQHIQFVASITDLATQSVKLVSRDGTETPLLYPPDAIKDFAGFHLHTYSVSTADDTHTRLTLNLREPLPLDLGAPRPILLIGNRVYGYSDAPYATSADGRTLSVVVPTDSLRANPDVILKALFVSADRQMKLHVYEFEQSPQAPTLRLLQQDKNKSTFLVFGSHLSRFATVLPASSPLQAMGGLERDDVATLVIQHEDLAHYKFVTLRTPGGLIVDLPLPKADAEEPLSSITPPAPVLQGTDEIVVTGTALTTLESVSYKTITLKLAKQGDGKAVWIAGLKAAGATATVGTQPLELTFKAGKQTLSLQVVAAK